jgi:ABC-type amino acid transport system permease subunit
MRLIVLPQAFDLSFPVGNEFIAMLRFLMFYDGFVDILSVRGSRRANFHTLEALLSPPPGIGF